MATQLNALARALAIPEPTKPSAGAPPWPKTNTELPSRLIAIMASTIDRGARGRLNAVAKLRNTMKPKAKGNPTASAYTYGAASAAKAGDWPVNRRSGSAIAKNSASGGASKATAHNPMRTPARAHQLRDDGGHGGGWPMAHQPAEHPERRPQRGRGQWCFPQPANHHEI